MKWIVFVIFAYVALALETGLGRLLAIPGPTGASPSFVLILGVFIGLMAPSLTAAWAMLILGVLIDLQPGDLGYPLIGPAALAYLVGAFAALQLRAMVLRQSVITLVTMVFVVGLLVHLVIVAMLVLRGWVYQPIAGWSPANALYVRFGSLLYTAAVAIPVGYVLFRFSALWGFASKSRYERHHY